jgi:hypothetical protein
MKSPAEEADPGGGGSQVSACAQIAQIAQTLPEREAMDPQNDKAKESCVQLRISWSCVLGRSSRFAMPLQL